MLGSNAYGQLGDGTTADRYEPVLVQGFYTLSAKTLSDLEIYDDAASRLYYAAFHLVSAALLTTAVSWLTRLASKKSWPALSERFPLWNRSWRPAA